MEINGNEQRAPPQSGGQKKASIIGHQPSWSVFALRTRLSSFRSKQRLQRGPSKDQLRLAPIFLSPNLNPRAEIGAPIFREMPPGLLQHVLTAWFAGPGFCPASCRSLQIHETQVLIVLIVRALFSRRFREGTSFPKSLERSILKLPLSKLYVVPFDLQN